MTAAQVTPKDQSYMIPTPEAAVHISDYDVLYPPVFKQRKGFIRHTGTIEDLQFMQSKYMVDSEDLQFLNIKSIGDVSDKQKIFELVLECFEDGANKFSEGIVSVDSSLERIRNDVKLNALLEKETTESELESWLNYWREKRKRNFCSLIPSLKFEDVGKIGADPYVCFRRRELKQPRKTRRSDAQVMEKIKKIYYDLDTLKVMLTAGIKRDKFKKESASSENSAFEKYWTLRTWQQEYGIERPPTLPSFKAFHLQVPYFPGSDDTKKQAHGGSQHNLNKKRPIKKTESSSEGESCGEENEEENGNVSVADLIKISIPPAAIKSVRYSRPYYPFEVVKQIQKDVEALLTGTEEEDKYRDFTADLGSISRANEDLRKSREKFINFRTNLTEKVEMIRNRHSQPDVLVLRNGRCGRLIQSGTRSNSQISPVLNKSDFTLKERIFYPEALNHLRSIQARDCAHLNNAFVGNYNQHYIQCTGNLTVPTSLPSWISATSGLLQNNNNKATSNKTPATGVATSPNKKKRPNEESSSEDQSKKMKSSTSTESTISSLTASPQFTVKVKSKMDSSSSSSASSGIEDAEDLMETAAEITQMRKSANAARFTPTGLQKESRLD